MQYACIWWKIHWADGVQATASQRAADYRLSRLVMSTRFSKP
jgi:hypothetical protein